ncbi:protein FAR1-related sequence 5, partial [Tanacetum coccineum]
SVPFDTALTAKYTEKIVAYENENDETQAVKRGKEKAIEKSSKNRNACSLCESFDHNKRRCPKRFEYQEQVVVQEEVVQEKEDLVQEEDLV